MRIVFMGTPDYSVRTLEALKEVGHDIVAVFCRPDKPVGRKQILTPPPTKVFANSNGIPCYQPKTLRDGEAEKIIRGFSPDVIVVVAYGLILPEGILTAAKYGCVNGHASLLPRHRGASPIQWCIVCGDKETGVTTMLMDKGMDTGDILKTAKTDIGEYETADELFCRLSHISAKLMVETLKELENGTAVPKKQPETGVTYAPIITKDMAHLDFFKTATEIKNAVCGYYSWPCAFCFIDSKRVKVIKCLVVNGKGTAGTVIENNGKLVVACGGNTAVELTVIQPEGSKPMEAKDYLSGHKIELGTIIN